MQQRGRALSFLLQLEQERENQQFPQNLQRPSDVLTHSVHPQKVWVFCFFLPSPPHLIFLEQKNPHLKNNQYLINSRATELPFFLPAFRRGSLSKGPAGYFCAGGANVPSPDADRNTGPFISALISERSVNSCRGEQSSAVIPSPGGTRGHLQRGKNPRRDAEPSQHPQGNSALGGRTLAPSRISPRIQGKI